MAGEDRAIEESDCCGNGCVNCILNAKRDSLKTPISLQGKKNIIGNYSKFVLVNCKRPNEQLQDVVELHFASSPNRRSPSSDDPYVLHIPAGQHIMMRKQDSSLLRPYSPFWVDWLKMEFKLLVNLKVIGPMSQYIRRLNVGDEVDFRGPLGGEYECRIDKTGDKYVFIITQGVAIAPALRIIEEILENEEDETRVMHFACFADSEHIYFREKLYELNKYWNYKGFVYLSRQQCGEPKCLDNHRCLNDCKNFLKGLRYKEQVYSRRLDCVELREKCESTAVSKNVFIIAGARHFQDHFLKIVNEELDIKNKNTFLL